MTNVSTLAWPWGATGAAVAFGTGTDALVVGVGLKAGTAFLVAAGAGALVAAATGALVAAATGALVAAATGALVAGVSDVVSLPQATAIIANNITMDRIRYLGLRYQCNIPICPPTLI